MRKKEEFSHSSLFHSYRRTQEDWRHVPSSSGEIWVLHNEWFAETAGPLHSQWRVGKGMQAVCFCLSQRIYFGNISSYLLPGNSKWILEKSISIQDSLETEWWLLDSKIRLIVCHLFLHLHRHSSGMYFSRDAIEFETDKLSVSYLQYASSKCRDGNCSSTSQTVEDLSSGQGYVVCCLPLMFMS